VSVLLRSNPGLLQDFNALLPSNDYRIECTTDSEEVDLIAVTPPLGAYIKDISGSDTVPPAHCVSNTEELRHVLSTENEDKLLTLESGWASCTLQLLQSVRVDFKRWIQNALTTVIFHQELDNEMVSERYRRKCLRCLRQLVRKSGALPPSFFLRNVVREGNHPVGGGASAVSESDHSFELTVSLSGFVLGHLEGAREQLCRLFQSSTCFHHESSQGGFASGLRSTHTVQSLKARLPVDVGFLPRGAGVAAASPSQCTTILWGQ
jgi:hypothetical protein